MPIYEYQCPECGNVFEEWAKASDAHKTEPCPVCGAQSPRIISRTSFVLKGDGWYVSDYGYRKGITDESGPANAPAKSTSKHPAKQAPKALAKKESKPPAPKAKSKTPATSSPAKAASPSPKASPANS